MAPGYRAHTTTRRQNRTGLIDHGEYDGLPIRHWRRDYVTIVPAPEQDLQAVHGDIWALELPHGMPKDAQLLPQHCQDLLRAARSGKIYKRPTLSEEDDLEHDTTQEGKPEKKEDDDEDKVQKGFTAKAWRQIPRQQEGPDMEYLAKPRKGLIKAGTEAAAAPLYTYTKTTVKRTDAAGNEYLQDVIVAPGQVVEGVVIAQVAVDAAGKAVMPTPPKRKAPPVPKKRKGGPGRKKRVKIEENESGAVGVDGASGQAGETTNGGVADENKGREGHEAGDVNMVDADDSNGGSDDDDEEGDGDDKDDDEDASQEATRSPSQTQRTTPPEAGTVIQDAPEATNDRGIDTEMADAPSTPSQENAKQAEQLNDTSPRPDASIKASPPTVGDGIAVTEASTSTSQSAVVLPASPTLDIPAIAESISTAAQDLPPPPPEPTIIHEVAAAEVRQEEEEEETMLLDVIERVDHALADSAAAQSLAPTTTLPLNEVLSAITPEVAGPIPPDTPEQQQQQHEAAIITKSPTDSPFAPLPNDKDKDIILSEAEIEPEPKAEVVTALASSPAKHSTEDIKVQAVEATGADATAPTAQTPPAAEPAQRDAEEVSKDEQAADVQPLETTET